MFGDPLLVHLFVHLFVLMNASMFIDVEESLLDGPFQCHHWYLLDLCCLITKPKLDVLQ